VLAGEVEGHGGGEGGQYVGLDAVTHAVGKNGDDAVLLTHVLREEDVTADTLTMMVALLAVHLYEKLSLHPPLRVKWCHPTFSGGTIPRWS